MMRTGGGESSYGRADHGIAITETDDVSFVDYGNDPQTEYDFRYNAHTGSALWIR